MAALEVFRYEDAHRLYREAAAYFQGKELYVPDDSELRLWATRFYGRATLTTLTLVCGDVFHMLARRAEEGL